MELLERMDRKQMSMKPDQVVIMVEVKAVGVGTMAVEDMAEVVMVEAWNKGAGAWGGSLRAWQAGVWGLESRLVDIHQFWKN